MHVKNIIHYSSKSHYEFFYAILDEKHLDHYNLYKESDLNEASFSCNTVIRLSFKLSKEHLNSSRFSKPMFSCERFHLQPKQELMFCASFNSFNCFCFSFNLFCTFSYSSLCFSRNSSCSCSLVTLHCWYTLPVT